MTAFAPGPVASLKIRVTPDLMACVPGVQQWCLESCGLSVNVFEMDGRMRGSEVHPGSPQTQQADHREAVQMWSSTGSFFLFIS